MRFVDAIDEPVPGVFLIPTKSDRVGNYSRYPPHEKEPHLSKLPELSLALKTEAGAVIISGCSHSGIEKITNEVKTKVHDQIDLVMGGFHLMPFSGDDIHDLAKRMRVELGVSRVAPSHCTGHIAFSIFKEVYAKHYLFGGLGAQIEIASGLRNNN